MISLTKSLPVLPIDESCRFRYSDSGRCLMWELTRFCNLACLHCCTDSSPHALTDNDVSFERAIAVIKEFPKLNIKSILFSGGEALLRKDFMLLLKEIDTSLSQIHIASNGMPITVEVAQALKAIGVTSIDISLDGYNAETHNAVRLNKFAFEKAITGIKNCIAADLPLRIPGMITPINVDFIDSFIQLLVSLGVKKTVLSTVVGNAGRAKFNPHLMLPSEFIPKAVEAVHKVQKTYGDVISIDHRLTEETQEIEGCSAGQKFVFISPEGDVSGCSWLFKVDQKRFGLGNIKKDTLQMCLDRNDSLMRPLTELTSWCPIPYVRS